MISHIEDRKQAEDALRASERNFRMGTLLDPDNRGAERTWGDNYRTGMSHDVTCRLRCSDGTYRWFQVRGEPLRTSDGRIL